MAQVGARSRAQATPLAALDAGTLKNVLLVRCAITGDGGITRAELRRDLTPLVAHRLSPAEWRRELDALLLALLDEGLVRSARLRIATTRKGADSARRFLGMKLPKGADWGEVRDVLLVARALGLEPRTAPRRRKLASAFGLRTAILESAFGLPARGADSVAAVRDALANKIGPRSPLQAQSGPNGARRPQRAKGRTAESRRVISGLLRRPREFDSDEALMAELAAEQVGAIQTSAPSLRIALLRRLLGRPAKRPKAPADKETAGHARALTFAQPSPRPVRVALAAREGEPRDLRTFATAVMGIAGECAEGWPGSRRAFVSRVWRSLAARHPEWRVSEAVYKDRLVEAHRAGHLTLAYADLRDAANLSEVEASTIRDRNTEWHFIRVED